MDLEPSFNCSKDFVLVSSLSSSKTVMRKFCGKWDRRWCQKNTSTSMASAGNWTILNETTFWNISNNETQQISTMSWWKPNNDASYVQCDVFNGEWNTGLRSAQISFVSDARRSGTGFTLLIGLHKTNEVLTFEQGHHLTCAGIITLCLCTGPLFKYYLTKNYMNICT